jgi:maltooligosyltrehalose trehalohydrolase
VVDPSQFEWTDRAWKGIGPIGQVLYELHLGTFTPEGTCAAAVRELPALRDLGITCIELMPVAEFAGRWGWGYDGVALFAPYHHYGAPDDFRLLIDNAHELGMGVILDLVYNHLGPDGNYLRAFAEEYFNREHMTDWGEAINFDGPNAGPVREFFVANAAYWVREFHVDGFRFDATQAIVDGSPEHILAAISRETRRAAAEAGRTIYITNENEPQQTGMVRPAKHGGIGFDSLWNDDFHHSAAVALIGRNEAFYTDYEGSAQELLSAAKWGYLYQGQRYKWQQQRRGTPALDLPPSAFVHFLQNHDQIANFGRGHRLDRMTSPALLRALTAFWLLMPQTPMFFQGQEYAASRPFHYFADHNPELSDLIRQGRNKELSQFPAMATDEMRTYLVDPAAEDTFAACRLDHSERQRPFHREMLSLHRDLLRLRREDLAPGRTGRRGELDGAVLGRDALVLRFFGDMDRLLLLNLGRDLRLDPAPEPLLAPPRGMRWQVQWSSEDPRYGGYGTAPPDTEQEGWFLQGRSALVLKPAPEAEAKVETRYRVLGSAQAARRRTEGS